MWRKIKKFISRYWKLLLGITIVTILVIVALATGNIDKASKLIKEFCKKFFQSSPGVDPDPIKTANTIPDGRVDKDGKPIPIGTADQHGVVQDPVKPLDVGILDGNKTTVKVDGQTTALPEGVTAGEVKHVVKVDSNVTVVSVKDNTGVDANALLADIKKQNKKS